MLIIFLHIYNFIHDLFKEQVRRKTQTLKPTLTNASQCVKSLKRVFGFPVSESLYVATETAEDKDKAVALPLGRCFMLCNMAEEKYHVFYFKFFY